MEQVRDILQLLTPLANIANLNKIDEVPTLKVIEQKLSIKPSQLAALALIGLSLYVISYFIRVSNIFVWFFSYFFPAYFTLIALRDENQQVYTKYLIYWVLYPLFLQTEPVFKMLFNKTIFNMVRLTITALFLSPNFELSTRFFESVLRPFLENEKTRAITGQLDNFVHQGQQKWNEVKNKIKKNAQT